MKKEKYIAPTTTFDMIVEEGILAEGSIQGGGSGSDLGGSDVEPGMEEGRDAGFSDSSFDFGSWE